MKPTIYIPVNQTGYGIHATYMTYNAVKSGLVNLVPYWKEIDPCPMLGEDYKNIALEGISKRSEYEKAETGFIFCHGHLLTGPNKKLIGFTQFEILPFDPKEIEIISKLAMIGTASKWGRDILSSLFGKDKSYYIPAGTDINLFSPRLPKPGNIFISIGKFEKRKGHIAILKALNMLSRNNIEITLRALWSNPFIPQDIIKTNIIRHGFSYTGRDTNSNIETFRRNNIKIELYPRLHSRLEIAGLIQTSNFGLYPSAAEGWNLPLLDTMSCGIPCITTMTTAHTEYISKENAIIVTTSKKPAIDIRFFRDTTKTWDEPDELSLRKSIETVLHIDSTQYHLISQRSRRTATLFSWQESQTKFSQFINKLEKQE